MPEKTKSAEVFDNAVHTVSSGDVSLGTSSHVDRPEPDCGYEGTVCKDAIVTLPPTYGNQAIEVVAVRYYLSNRGSAPIKVNADTELDWCKIYGAIQINSPLPDQGSQIQVKALVKNWSDAYAATGRIEVDWQYIQP